MRWTYVPEELRWRNFARTSESRTTVPIGSSIPHNGWTCCVVNVMPVISRSRNGHVGCDSQARRAASAQSPAVIASKPSPKPSGLQLTNVVVVDDEYERSGRTVAWAPAVHVLGVRDSSTHAHTTERCRARLLGSDKRRRESNLES